MHYLVVFLFALLVSTSSFLDHPQAHCSPDEVKLPQGLVCLSLKKACVDQQQFITHDLRFQPSQSNSQRPPKFDVSDLWFNWPNPTGNGDKFITGHNLHYPEIVIRANTSEEACVDLLRPSFSCQVPLIVWSRWPYNIAEAFGNTYARLLNSLLISKGLTSLAEIDDIGQYASFPSRLVPVMATPHGLNIPSYMHVFAKALFTNHTLMSLAELSSRSEQSCSSSSRTKTPEAQDEGPPRCYQSMHLCRFQNRYDRGLVTAARYLASRLSSDIEEAVMAAGLGDFWAGSRANAMKVIVASRPPESASRTLLNEEEILQACNAWEPSDSQSPFSSARCISYRFGSHHGSAKDGDSLLIDIGVVRDANVLICLHGAACLNSYFMRNNGSSVVEVRPRGMSQGWSNQYFFQQLEKSRLILWYGIDIHDEVNAMPSEWERSKSSSLNPRVVARERHVRLPWPALKHHLNLISQVGQRYERYKELAYDSGEFYIDDHGDRINGI